MRGPIRRLDPTRLLRIAALCALVGTSGAPASALNMTLGDVRVQQLSAYGFEATNSVLSFDNGTTDELYQMWGYLGNASDTVQVSNAYFNIQSNINQISPGVGRSSVILDNNGGAALGLAAGNIRIDYTFTLVNDTTPLDYDGFLWDVSITNLSASALDLVFYQYLDLDLGGAADFADDLADANSARIVVTDNNSPRRFVWHSANGGSADHFQVGVYPSVSNLLNGMAAASDLSDAPASFGPADFTAAFQYDFYLPAGATYVLASGRVAAPEPSPVLLTLSGLIGISFVSRRARRLQQENASRRTA